MYEHINNAYMIVCYI